MQALRQSLQRRLEFLNSALASFAGASDLIPEAFRPWLQHVESHWPTARRDRSASGALLTYALLCRERLLSAAARTSLREVQWRFPDFGLPLGWLDELASRLPTGATESEAAISMEHDDLRLAYELLIPAGVRRVLGEHYTPEWLADHVVSQTWANDLRWMDPTVGAGAFVLALGRRAQREHAEFEFVGVDRNPWALLAAAANYAVVASDPNERLPLLCADVLTDTLPACLHQAADRVLGNPPWILWDQLQDEYRVQLRHRWDHFHLLPERGMHSILGGGKKDVSMLVTYQALEDLVKAGGRLSFVITAAVFTSARSGRGFRRFRLPDGEPISVQRVDDFTDLKPFSDVQAQCTAMVLAKGKPLQYPVPYMVWKKGSPPSVESRKARPSDPNDALSSWSRFRPEDAIIVNAVLGSCEYRAHLGVNTGGANGVYWLHKIREIDLLHWEMRNLPHRSKRTVTETTATLEASFLFPLLVGKDVQPWRSEPSAWIAFVQDVGTRKGIDPAALRGQAPQLYAYLERFEELLRSRAAFKRYFQRLGHNKEPVDAGPFYSMFDVGDYTLSPAKVVWNRMGSRLGAAVVTHFEGKVVLPQETHAFFAVASADEAYYLAALLNSRLVQKTLEAIGQVGGKSFATPNTIEKLNLRKFDVQKPIHRKLAKLGEAAWREAATPQGVAQATARLIDDSCCLYWGVKEHEIDGT